MKITRDNYEAWFLDYLEGNLEEGKVDEFIEFLQLNPDLKEELRLYEPVALEAGLKEFPSKERLYKEPLDLPEAFDQAAVAYLEGDLKEEKRQQLEEYIAHHPDKRKELDLFRMTFLAPDASLSFAGRHKLYRRSTAKTVLMWSRRIAAALLLAWGTYAIVWQTSHRPAGEEISASVPSLQPGSTVTTPGNASSLPGNVAVASGENLNPSSLLPVKTDGTSTLAAIDEKIIAPVKKAVSPTLPVTADEAQASRLLPEEMPVLIPRKSADLAYAQTEPVLAAMEILLPDLAIEENFEEGIDITGWVKEKTGLSQFTFRKLVKGGLDLAAGITRDKVGYQANTAGEITALTLETALLGLSIPLGSNE